MKLYVHPASPNSVKVLVVANLLGIPFEAEVVDLLNGAQFAPDYVAINPNAKAPALRDGDFTLWESNAIMHYLAALKPETGLWPGNARAQADVVRWLSWDLAHLAATVRPFQWERMFKPMFGKGAPDEAVLTEAEAPFRALAAILEAALANESYLVGSKLTLADISLAARLMYAEPAGVPLHDYPAIGRWRRMIADLPAWRAALPAQQGLAA